MKDLKLIITRFAAAALVAVFRFNANAELSEADARAQLKRGALVVDVRTVKEFNTKHLANVVNLPLAELKEKFSTVVTNKSDVVLLHCASGQRSRTAERELRALGYTNVFNIGSYSKAEKILRDPTR